MAPKGLSTKRGRSERPALLSDKERRLLQRAQAIESLMEERARLQHTASADTRENRKRILKIRKISRELAEISRGLSVLVKALDHRMNALGPDLRMIIGSPVLRRFLRIRAQYVDDITYPWQEIHRPRVGHNYATWQLKQVHRIKMSESDPSKQTQRRIRCYWLDVNLDPSPKFDDVFRPEYALRGIKSKSWLKIGTGKISVREILREAVELDYLHQEHIANGIVQPVLPISEEKSIDIHDIRRNIEHFRKTLQDKQYDIGMFEQQQFKKLSGFGYRF